MGIRIFSPAWSWLFIVVKERRGFLLDATNEVDRSTHMKAYLLPTFTALESESRAISKIKKLLELKRHNTTFI